MACLSDSEAHLALDKEDPFALQTKPHGHGDVHALLHSSGLLKRWVAAGVKWVAFFQDTNGLVFRGLPAAIGAHACNPSRLLPVQRACMTLVHCSSHCSLGGVSVGCMPVAASQECMGMQGCMLARSQKP